MVFSLQTFINSYTYAKVKCDFKIVNGEIFQGITFNKNVFHYTAKLFFFATQENY